MDVLASPPGSPTKARSRVDKGPYFWGTFLALCGAVSLTALDLTAVSTLLPTMAADLRGSDSIWIGSGFALASASIIPWIASFAAIFGRKQVLLGSLALFSIGSAITGFASTTNIAILGRTLQGVGGGGINTATDIILVDIIPLSERGFYLGILGSVFGIASVLGPPMGGAFASADQWRWLFWLNIPLSIFAGIAVIFCLKLKGPPSTNLREKVARMDFFNILFVAASTSALLGLAFGGSAYPWSSYKVITPLCVGVAGLVAYAWCEKRFAAVPTVPFSVLGNWTTCVGLATSFVNAFVLTCTIYYLPLYFQSSKGASPLMSGVDCFPLAFAIAPSAILAGWWIAKSGKYKLQNFFGWALTILGFCLMTLLKSDSSTGEWVGCMLVLGFGMGTVCSAAGFPVIAPVQPDDQAAVSAFHGFVQGENQDPSILPSVDLTPLLFNIKRSLRPSQ
ncbi:hypothetical protein P7C70_g7374, partial [Phenoliferia sp. Uapishka_3]